MAVTAMLSHKRLRQELKVRGMTEEKFAESLGITDRHLRNLISKDTNSSCSVLYRASKALDVPMEDLIEVTETNTKEP